MKIYTRTGDDGTTSLSGGKRISKNNVCIEACGNIDELVSWVGLLKDHTQISEHKDLLFYIQEQLMTFIAVLASDNYEGSLENLHPDSLSSEKLEKEIDIIQSVLPPLKEFIIPGGNILVSYCHIARCVCRRVLPNIVLYLILSSKSFLFLQTRLQDRGLIWSVCRRSFLF